MTNPRYKQAILIGAIGALILILLVVTTLGLLGAADHLHIRDLPRDVRSAELVKVEGKLLVKVRWADGVADHLSPEEFASELYQQHQERSVAYRAMLKALNVSSTTTIGWVLLGLLGQLLFAGRMVVQWIASEKQQRSVVPVAFWWMALGGATLLLVYFIWRKDVVGILGQATGWLIYSRNLFFIYGRALRPASDEPRPPVASGGSSGR